jgi:hypothetical protein
MDTLSGRWRPEGCLVSGFQPCRAGAATARLLQGKRGATTGVVKSREFWRQNGRFRIWLRPVR